MAYVAASVPTRDERAERRRRIYILAFAVGIVALFMISYLLPLFNKPA